MSGLLHIFDPEAVILGGHVADAGRDLLQEHVAHLVARAVVHQFEPVEVEVEQGEGPVFLHT